MSHEDGTLQLLVPEHWGQATPGDAIMVAYGADPQDVQEKLDVASTTVRNARQLGMSIVRSTVETATPTCPNEYTIRGREIPREQQESKVRSVLPNIRIPSTLDFEAYDDDPSFPVVAKAPTMSCGRYKYMIDTPGQWQRLRTFLTGSGPFRELSEEDQAGYKQDKVAFAAMTPDMPIYQAAQVRMGQWEKWIKHVENPFDQTFDHFLEYQEVVETPSDRFTSYRVVTSATGEILASSLYYSAATKGQQEPLTTNRHANDLQLTAGCDPFELLTAPGSLVYLGARSFQSNKSLGGNGIVLDPTADSKPQTTADQEILIAHGLDPKIPRLPDELRHKSAIIGRTLGRDMGVVVGIDWLQEKETDNFYYLEINGCPGPQAFIDARFGGNMAENTGAVAMNKVALQSLLRS